MSFSPSDPVQFILCQYYDYQIIVVTELWGTVVRLVA
jgi:hypothetical protein